MSKLEKCIMAEVHILVYYQRYETADNIGVFADINDALAAVEKFNEEHDHAFEKDHTKDYHWTNDFQTEDQGLVIETWEVK